MSTGFVAGLVRRLVGGMGAVVRGFVYIAGGDTVGIWAGGSVARTVGSAVGGEVVSGRAANGVAVTIEASMVEGGVCTTGVVAVVVVVGSVAEIVDAIEARASPGVVVVGAPVTVGPTLKRKRIKSSSALTAPSKMLIKQMRTLNKIVAPACLSTFISSPTSRLGTAVEP